MFEEFDKSLSIGKNTLGAKIKVIGVGGAGCNAVTKMSEDDLIRGVEFILANTDRQAMQGSKINQKIVLGENLTKGLGAGANPDIGAKAASESLDEIKEAVKESDLIFIAAGMGGGTGTGAAHIIAKAARDSGALVVSIVTTPFVFEGHKREQNSEKGLNSLRMNVDSIIIISNERLLAELGGIPLTDAFQYSDAILKQAVRTITDLINKQSLINLDFADVKTIIKDKGRALIGTGRAKGENAAVEASIQAINSPILESSIEGARYALVNVLGGPKSLSIAQAQEAVETIKEASSPDIDIIFGVTINEDVGDEIVVSVIATGLEQTKEAPKFSSHISNSAQSLFKNETDIQKYKDNFTREVMIKNKQQVNDKTTEESFESLLFLKSRAVNHSELSEEEDLKLEDLMTINEEK